MFDLSAAKLSFQALSPAPRSLITAAMLMASAAAGGQQAATKPSANSPAPQAAAAVPDRSNTWTAPPGCRT